MKNRIAKAIPMALALILMLTMAAGCPAQEAAPQEDAPQEADPTPAPIAETRIIVDQRGIEVAPRYSVWVML